MFAPAGPLKGRGTVWAIEHRFSTDQRSEFDDGWGTLEQAATEIYTEEYTLSLHDALPILAYVRFASVYREFEDVDAFRQLIRDI